MDLHKSSIHTPLCKLGLGIPNQVSLYVGFFFFPPISTSESSSENLTLPSTLSLSLICGLVLIFIPLPKPNHCFLCEQLSVRDSFWIRGEGLCAFPLSVLGLHLAWSCASLGHAAIVSVSSYILFLLHLEDLVSIVSSIPTGSYNFSLLHTHSSLNCGVKGLLTVPHLKLSVLSLYTHFLFVCLNICFHEQQERLL